MHNTSSDSVLLGVWSKGVGVGTQLLRADVEVGDDATTLKPSRGSKRMCEGVVQDEYWTGQYYQRHVRKNRHASSNVDDILPVTQPRALATADIKLCLPLLHLDATRLRLRALVRCGPRWCRCGSVQRHRLIGVRKRPIATTAENGLRSQEKRLEWIGRRLAKLISPREPVLPRESTRALGGLLTGSKT